MALKSCRECGDKVSDEVHTCPHCGVLAPVPPPPPQAEEPPTWGQIALTGIPTIGLLLVLVGMMYGWFDGPPDPTATERARIRSEQIDVAVLCERAVRQQLRSPRSARFPSGAHRSVHVEGTTAELTSYLDAQNAFGAEIRTTYVCTAAKSAGRWTARAELLE